ncbi:Terminal organelle assembly protein [Parasponia andersonii]|uniref:Terminal organelle assembly protein n=1 Tax=Parasponia andersonii TaxID=3476 RepID=A0A2P5D553_PARAD|nr:Terminal organelle assembly protein [Parasponia andersonii]
MADPSRSPTPDFYSILGISTTSSSIKEICKAYKSLVTKLNPDKNTNPSNQKQGEDKFTTASESHDKSINGKSFEDHEPLTISEPTTVGFDNGKSMEDGYYYSILSRNKSSRRSKTPTPRTSLSRSVSRRSKTPNLSRNTSQRSSSEDLDYQFSNILSRSGSRRSTSETHINMAAGTGLSRNTSRRSTTPIVFSQSTAWKKPPPVEKKLECTLEELLEGCLKKIKITRNVIAETGIIVQEEETLWINVKPGWKKGTKITFEGKGDEKPGFLPADIILSIGERRHPLYEREGEYDLELVVEIPLVNALTGCSIPIPLLGGDTMTLSFDDIIHPGYEKVIRGQGMPNPKQHARRGDLRIKFLVEFPTELSDEQRAEAVGFLQDCY